MHCTKMQSFIITVFFEDFCIKRTLRCLMCIVLSFDRNTVPPNALKIVKIITVLVQCKLVLVGKQKCLCYSQIILLFLQNDILY